jgi:signal transduction histidine kinase
MKLATQSFMLMTGIALMPVLVISSFIAYESVMARSLDANMAEILSIKSVGHSEKDTVMRIIDKRPPDSEMTVAGPDGRIIWSSIAKIQVGADFDSVVHDFTKNPIADRLLVVGFSLPMPAGYRAALLIPRSFLLRSRAVDDYINAGLVSFIAILLFASMMSIITLRSITRSVLSLETATRRVVAGELDVPITVAGTSEIASLAHSLDSLRAQIKEDLARRARFIMGISHDLKTPLALIKGYAETLEEALASDDKTASSRLAIILSKVDQLECNINDLIDFERVNTGDWSRGFLNVELGSFLGAFCSRIKPDAGLLGRSVEQCIDLHMPAPVMMDERLFTRALENIVNNALRYSGEGGHVTVLAKTEACFYRVSVLDDGVGISARDIPHIFEPFYRGSTSRREQGMGLGLSIVKTIIESHGWEIEVQSIEGVYTEFIIRIPR